MCTEYHYTQCCGKVVLEHKEYKSKNISEELNKRLKLKFKKVHGSRDYFQFQIKGYTFELIPDEGMSIPLGNLNLQAIPAHYVHSSGNFSLYDPEAKILFSGDIGAAIIPKDGDDPFVKNFDAHLPLIEGFHKRWLGTNEHKNQWCERVLELDLDFLAPQHGLIYQGKMIKTFLEWLHDLKVGQIVY